MRDDRSDSVTSFPEGDAASTRLVLLRHGAAMGSEEGLFYGRTDVDLLPRGEEQVRGVAARLGGWLDEGRALHVYASPLLRARRSASILCDALGVRLPEGGPATVAELAELDLGAWEGESYASLQEKAPERLRAHYDDLVHSRPPGGGESLEDLSRRVLPALEKMRERHRGDVLLVSAHAAVNRAVVCDALGAPMESFFRIDQDFAALNVIDYHGKTPVVRLMNG